ncbi:MULTISPECIES: response regulator transcription factor [Pseudoalteromonas]|jgi:DNA-binding NarL/FixJ family response regulator|uniref:DNA-binding response regulator n=1 Tax=Pseudoalteromonas lipolytica TaxID=570156 RepID=A0AAD0S1B8_9GAMM|nr:MULTISPECIES: response regulator transcription factor [Pseudoalteromonas]AXV66288.1 DNA-binding response regulator [Pseudoalteromonas donghaensis]EWH04922.1 LuxR family transcriptional regulator [Pseudoalteromonas lipolytica SCSIO 04301]MAE01171.1 DNA-binding response regulator [Pseudoalteromonas sp.]MBE0349831.1 two-component system, NarL family, nitrate/nitrite response regulator NarL [Pseudoalteromonas lipolytica LMEB 39]QMW14030.1 response regulator transcription factor [Pseudoalteromon|tara:strand:- start:3480 stop:4118 length:639 start_codon:yes stop_codon:yes gene_type:complete
MISVLIADDHTILRQGLVSLLSNDPDIRVLAEAADGLSAVQKALELKPMVIVIDISMPELNGMEAVKRLHEQLPEAKVLVLTMHEEQEYVIHMVRAGASGYLLKDSASDELIDAVKALAQGKTYFSQYAASVLATMSLKPAETWDDPYRNLTSREREVFHLIIEGKTTKDIARSLDISVKTAENHRGKVLDKLQVANAAELVRYAAKYNLLI